MQERHSLIWPEAPFGAGLVLSSSHYADPANTSFSCGDAFAAIPEISVYARVFQHLHQAGACISFGANAADLDKWIGDAPLILVNLDAFNNAEIASIKKQLQRGIRVAAFADRARLKSSAAALFSYPNALLIDCAPQDLDAGRAARLLPGLRDALQLPIRFPKGAAGYGFKMGKTTFIVVEDWLEQGRDVCVSVKATAKAAVARACNVNDHIGIPVRRDSEAWLLNVTLRPGDGVLIALEEDF
jgi:hypothetical protein